MFEWIHVLFKDRFEEWVLLNSYKVKVMRFMLVVLIDAPITFMRLMHEVLKPFLGKFVVVYLDGIFIFSRTKEEHLEYMRKVLLHLREEKLLINLKKCTFIKEELVYLVFVISNEGLNMDAKKVNSIL
jgi:hypothetical protein